MSAIVVPEMVAKELKANISRLESAIDELNHVRKDLQENTHQVKCEIHATVSRELEALRNREVWLLTQVDLLQNVKEEILRGQQAQINKALGSAQKVLQYAQTDGQDLLEKVSADMNRLELTDLEPEENSQISFQADAAGLRDTIMEFGRVEAGNRALQKVFADNYTPSASLPKSFEEYDDADHHVLYKTLEEVNRGKTSNSSIRVNIPKLALRTEDWLSRPAQSSTKPAESKSKKLAFPTLSNNISDWLLAGSESSEERKSPIGQSHPALTRDKSIQEWLLQIKHFPHTHDEEDDFEIVEHVTLSDAGDSGMDIPSSQSDPTNVGPGISSSHFKQVNPSTVNAWLKGGVTPPSTCQLENENGLFLGFRHNPSDTDGWLLNKVVCNRRCSQSPELVEIENLASLVRTSDQNIFTHHRDDQNTWLLQNRVPSGRVPPVGEVCKANERCQGYGECVSSPTCCQEYLMSSPTENIWLLNTTPSTDINNQDQPAFTHIKNMSKNHSDWLAYGHSVNSSGNIDKGAFSKWFACMPEKCSDWLKVEESMDIEAETSNEKQPNSFDLDFWLVKRCAAEEYERVSPFCFSTFEAFQKNLSSAAWLLRGGANTEGLIKTDLEELESEKKDLTSEKEEFSMWLLNGGKNEPHMCPPKASPIPDITEWLVDQTLC